MNNPNPTQKKENYTEFVSKGGEVFPKDMYPIRETSFTKIKYCQC